MDRELYHLEKTYRDQPYISFCQPVRPVWLNGMENLCKHQLSSVCLVVPFWLAVKWKFDIRILTLRWTPEFRTFYSWWFLVTKQVLVLAKQDHGPVLYHICSLCIDVANIPLKYHNPGGTSQLRADPRSSSKRNSCRKIRERIIP